MFEDCDSLTAIPALPALELADSCYYSMFADCSNVKLESNSTEDCIYVYRIPMNGVGVDNDSYSPTYGMFEDSSGSSVSPTINTAYYTNATIVY